MLRKTLFLIPLLAAGVLAVACDPGEGFRVENQTDQNISVYEDGNYIKDISPGDSVDFQILYFRNGLRTWQARGVDGELLAERTFTWDEINDTDGLEMIVKKPGDE
jgi:hypothetical protein